MFRSFCSLGAVFVLSSAALVSAATSPANLGEGLKPKMGTQGRTNLSITYAYDNDRAWSLLIATDFPKAKLDKLPAKLYWTLLDLKSQAPLQQWTEMEKTNLTLGGYEVVDLKALKQLLPNMKNYALVISADKKTNLYHMPIGEYCLSYSRQVTDLTKPGSAPCAVNAAHIPGSKL